MLRPDIGPLQRVPNGRSWRETGLSDRLTQKVVSGLPRGRLVALVGRRAAGACGLRYPTSRPQSTLPLASSSPLQIWLRWSLGLPLARQQRVRIGFGP
jgi:hypothetical protein